MSWEPKSPWAEPLDSLFAPGFREPFFGTLRAPESDARCFSPPSLFLLSQYRYPVKAEHPCRTYVALNFCWSADCEAQCEPRVWSACA